MVFAAQMPYAHRVNCGTEFRYCTSIIGQRHFPSAGCFLSFHTLLFPKIGVTRDFVHTESMSAYDLEQKMYLSSIEYKLMDSDARHLNHYALLKTDGDETGSPEGNASLRLLPENTDPLSAQCFTAASPRECCCRRCRLTGTAQSSALRRSA